MEIILLGVGIFLVVVFFSWIGDNVHRVNPYNQLKPRLDAVEKRENQLKNEQDAWARKIRIRKPELEILAKEKSKGFPWLLGDGLFLTPRFDRRYR